MEEVPWDEGLPLFAKPAPRQNYAPMAGKPTPSSRVPPPTEPGTCHTDLSVEKRKGWGRDGGKRLIQRLNEESGRQETLY